MAHDIFISHSASDKAVADAVCHALEAGGLRCWMAPRDVNPGRPFASEIMGGIRGAKAMVLVFTGAADRSAHVQREVTAALEGGATVVPFKIEDIEAGEVLGYYLAGVHWMDAFTPPLEAHLQRLVAHVKALIPARDDGTGAIERNLSRPDEPPVRTSGGRPPWVAPAALAGLVVVAVASLLWLVMGRSAAPPSNSNPAPNLALAPSADLPPRRAGMWRVTLTTGPQRTSEDHCLSDVEARAWGPAPQEARVCPTRRVRRVGEAVEIDSDCVSPQGGFTMHARLSGDFNARYGGQLLVNAPSAPTLLYEVRAERLGDCTPN